MRYTEPVAEMTGEQFKAKRLQLGLSLGGTAKLFRLGDRGARTVQRWESGERAIPWYVAVVFDAYTSRNGKLPPPDQLSRFSVPAPVGMLFECYETGGRLPDLEPYKRQPGYFAKRKLEGEAD